MTFGSLLVEVLERQKDLQTRHFEVEKKRPFRWHFAVLPTVASMSYPIHFCKSRDEVLLYEEAMNFLLWSEEA